MLGSKICISSSALDFFPSNFACQVSSRLEEIPWALAMRGESWHVPGALPLQCQPGAGVTHCKVPASPRVPGCTREIPDFTSPLLPVPRQPHTPPQGGLPAVGNAICTCTLPAVEAPSSFTVSYTKLRPSHAGVWPATCCRSDTSCFNFSHSYRLWQRFSSLQLPLLPALRRGRLLFALSEMTHRRVRFKDSQQRISTQAGLAKCTF